MPQINTYLTSAAADLAPLESLKGAFARNKLLFVGQTASLADPLAFQALFNALRKKSWIVYAKNPFGSPVHVWTTWAATPTVWRSPMTEFSPSIRERSPSVTGIEKIKTEKRP